LFYPEKGGAYHKEKVMGIILLCDRDKYLKEITSNRTVACIPFCGKYRLIDFILSNMVNAGIKNVGVFINNKLRSLMGQLGSGKEWDLQRKQDGLIILPCENDLNRVLRGDVEYLYKHLDYLNNSAQDYVLISNSNMVCNIDFKKVFDFHKQINADVTIVYKKEDENLQYIITDVCTTLVIDSDNRIIDMEVDPFKIRDNKISMQMYFMKKDLLLDLIEFCITRGKCDLVKNGFLENIDKLKIHGFEYKGYLARIDSLRNYYRYNMDLLKFNNKTWMELFFSNGQIYTKVKNDAPTKYYENCSVKNSIVSNGCLIDGKVINSILFSGVRVKKGAFIKDSIIMANTIIEENTLLENVILDKNVCISQSKNIKGDISYPMYIEKKTLV
jgi:glucose-1-phosphate adenylyltransferase